MTDIKDTLRKLQALSERAGTEQEAAVAALKMRELLEKHNLDIGSLKLEKAEGVQCPSGPKKRSIPDHYPILARATCELMDVEFFAEGSDKSGYQFFFIGLQANVEAAVVTFAYLIDSVEDLLDTWKHEPDSIFGKLWVEYSKKDYRAFRIGVSKRIHVLIQERKKAAAPASMELVLVGNAVARKMMDSMKFSEARLFESKVNQAEATSYHAGYSRGDQIDPHGAKKKRIRRGK